MVDEQKHSFGEYLKYFRSRTVDRRSGKLLSQDKFGDLLNKKTGLIVTRNKISNWEKDRASLHPQKERDILIDILDVLITYDGIKNLDEANQLLNAGNYQSLTPSEIDRIHPEWNRSEILQDLNNSIDATPSVLPSPINGPYEVKITGPIEVRHQEIKTGPGSAPVVPSLFVGRDDDLAYLKLNLGLSGDPGMSLQILTAIKGWPGVGKTTIASALAYDPDIQIAFPDGVLWVSLGQEPKVLSEMAAWGRALGTNELLFAKSVEEAQIMLTSLLRNRKMLLIIDDVWSEKDALPFKVGGLGCATLITTRRDDVANALAPSAANIYRLKVLDDDASLTLLKELAPTVVGAHPDEVLTLVKELEGLPLALQVAGRLLNAEVNRGFDVIDLIEELRKGTKLLVAKPPSDRIELVRETTPTIASLLQKSLDLLDETTRNCYAYLGVFAPRPATFDMDAMRDVWQMKDPKPIIETLVDRGLLEFVPKLARYQMHSILVMLAKSLLTDDSE